MAAGPTFHRGRRGQDRRGLERRTPREHNADAGREAAREGSVDVEQIMRDIRSRIAQRHGIELSTQQIQELAARRLEAILEPRHIKPQLLEQLRRSASTTEVPASRPIETYEFEENTIFETHRGIVRFFRRLLNPILKLFFNPTPLSSALNTQVRINKELAARELEREQRQSEWNALQFELVQRLVLETSRVSIEMQALGAKVESLNAKADFNERRVRGLETVPAATSSRPQPRQQEAFAPATPGSTTEGGSPEAPTSPTSPDGSGDGTRRRRRRRRGRRSGGGINDAPAATGPSATAEDDVEAGDGDEIEDDETTAEPAAVENPSGRPEVMSAPAARPEEPAARPEEASRPPVPDQLTNVPAATAPEAPPPTIPTPPRDEPVPQDPTDHADPGPIDR